MKNNTLRSLFDFKLFETLGESDLEILKRIGGVDIVHLAEGECLEGEEIVHRLFCIVSGTVDIEQVSLSGDLFIVERFNERDCIGANAVFLGENEAPPMQVYATKKTRMIVINKEALTWILKRDSECLLKYLQLISKRSLALARKVNALSTKPLREKILEYLQMLHAKQEQNPVELPMTKKRLAHMFSVARTSLSRRLKVLEEDGIITVEGRVVTLQDGFFRQ